MRERRRAEKGPTRLDERCRVHSAPDVIRADVGNLLWVKVLLCDLAHRPQVDGSLRLRAGELKATQDNLWFGEVSSGYKERS
jgi:hypothetical protein